MLILFWALLVPASHAQTAPPLLPIVQHYQNIAEQAVLELSRNQPNLPLVTLTHEQLLSTGLEIANQYMVRHAACAEQISVYLSELPKIHEKTIPQIMTRYHDGIGLPEAVKHCIYGRVYSVHPIINLMRMESELDEVRQQMIDDLQELIGYIPRLNQYLSPEPPKGNPTP